MNAKLGWPWFHFEVRSRFDDVPGSLDLLEQLVMSILDDPPFWAVGVEPKVSIDVLRTEKSKGHVVDVANPSRKTVRAALERRRQGRIAGAGVMFVRQDPPAAWITTDTLDSGSYCIGSFLSEGPGALADDERFGDTALRVARVLVEAAGSVRWGCGWFGTDSVPPHAVGFSLAVEPGQIFGYPYLVCLPSSVVEILGGVEAVRRGPASEVCEVTTATGERCVLALLRRAPADVTDDLLREWRAFLAPVTAQDAVARRQELFEQLGFPPTDAWWNVPPMVLADDWPTPPSSTGN